MKPDTLPFVRNYLSALRKHLTSGSNAPLKGARQVGSRAVRAGLQILDLARIHRDAMTFLKLSHDSAFRGNDIVRRAGIFFAEVITPVEAVHQGTPEANIHLQQSVEALRLRTEELAASNEELKREIAERSAVEHALRASELATSQLLKRSNEMQEELRHLSRRLFTIQEEERHRISRELHDVITQTLAGVNMRLAAVIHQGVSSSKSLEDKIEITQRLVAHSVELVHRFAQDLRPTVLDDLGLIPALESYFKEFIQQTGIRVRLTSFASVESFGTHILTALYRVTIEALSNVSRHANASEVHVNIQINQGAIHMEIHDNGCGFQIESGSFPKQGNNLGFLGMRERIEMLGGSFRVESAPGTGTILFFDLPSNSVKRTSHKRERQFKPSPPTYEIHHRIVG